MQELGMFIDLIAPALVSIIITSLFLAGLTRKVWNLQCDLSATQAQLLRERNQRASLGRSKDKESLELLKEMQGSLTNVPKQDALQKFGIRR